MSHLSIRKIPPELEKAIQKEARKRKTSKSRVVVDALAQVFQLSGTKPKPHRNVKAFFEKTNPQDYKELQKAMNCFSTIDEEMWK